MKWPHPDLELLHHELIRVTKQFLDEMGEYLPHGAIVTPEGNVGLVGSRTPEDQPGAQKTLKLLEAGLRQMAAQNKCRAAGIAIDIRLKNPPRVEDVGKDAIWTILEQRGGLSVSVYIPYWKSSSGQFTFGEPFSEPGAPRIFRLPT
jgi:hypothetical protein